jgi:hypothetical protein
MIEPYKIEIKDTINSNLTEEKITKIIDDKIVPQRIIIEYELTNTKKDISKEFEEFE